MSSFPIFFLGFLKETNYSGRERIVHRRQLLKLSKLPTLQAVEFPCTGAVVGIYTANGWSKRVQMTVSLASDFAEFVAFDSDISKLTNIRAAEISQQMKTQVSETPQSWALPQCIEDIVGRTFQLKFSRLKFLYKHQSFTVSRIYDTHRCRPQPILRTKVVITTLVMICLVVELLKYAI